MASKAKVVEIFYDVASPYSWFAFETLCRYRPHWNIDLRLRPFFLGGVFHAIRDGRPPSLNPRKGNYSAIDIERLSKYFAIPINEPKDFWGTLVKKGTLKPLRFITAINMSHPEFTEELSRQLWHRIYVQDVDATEAESLREAAVKSGMSDAVINDALQQMSGQRVKDKLKAVTQEALDQGAFGGPFIIVHVNGQTEIFFGSDRFHFIAMLLGEEWKGPLPDLV